MATARRGWGSASTAVIRTRSISRASTSPCSSISRDDNVVSFQIKGPHGITLGIQVTVSHVGGNVYDISTQVEECSPRQFTYSEPDESGSSLSLAPYLGKKIARHLLDEVEKCLGKELLRREEVPEV